jgi:hypothetical protein
MFYREASLLHPNTSEHILVSDSTVNPCISEMRKLGGQFLSKGLFETVEMLTHAEGFVLSRSTFSFALALLSKYAGIGKFYTFAYKWADIGSHWNCIPTERYERKVMSFWRSSPSQIAILKNETCMKWSYVERLAFFYHYHGRDGTPFRY